MHFRLPARLPRPLSRPKRQKSREAALSFAFAPTKFHITSALDADGESKIGGGGGGGGASSQLRSPPLLSVLSAVCLDKTQLLPSICMLAQPLCLGPGWTPARTVLLPFSPWEVQLKCAEVLPVTLSLDTTTASSGTHGPLQLSSPCLRFSLIQWPTMTCFHVRVPPRPQSIQTHTHTHTTTLSWELF